MSEELLKSMIKMKFEAVNIIINMFPENIQEPVQKLQNKLIYTVHEVTKEYVDKNCTTKDKKALKTIEIE